jgi:hypothetical protein
LSFAKGDVDDEETKSIDEHLENCNDDHDVGIYLYLPNSFKHFQSILSCQINFLTIWLPYVISSDPKVHIWISFFEEIIFTIFIKIR